LNQEFTEPDYRHVPGRNARPSSGVVLEMSAAAGDASSLQDTAAMRAWAYGLFLIRQGYYWEAHEVLEPVWMLAVPNSRERGLVQGFIQLANAALKLDMRRPRAAQRLAEMAHHLIGDAVRDFDGMLLGVDAGHCSIVVERAVEAISSDDEEWRDVLRAEVPKPTM